MSNAKTCIKSEVGKGFAVALITLGVIFIPVIYLILYIINFHFIRKLKLLSLSIFSLIIHILLFATVYPGYIDSVVKSKEKIVKNNVRIIDESLRNYYQEKGTLPADLKELVKAGYLVSLPTNPFSKESTREIKFGQSDFEGNLTYITVFIDDSEPCYYLLAYGSMQTDGHDADKNGTPDHVIIIQSNCDKDSDLAGTLINAN